MSSKLAAPQMVMNSRMLYTSWIPADPRAAAALLPEALEPAANGAIYMNQYVVDRAEQTTGFGAYSLTYLGLDVAGHPAPDGVTPGRFFTHYLNSSPIVREYAAERGVPASPGRTTYVDDSPVIRTRARVGEAADLHLAGHLRYITEVGGRLVSGNYPYNAEAVSAFEVLSIEFLDPSHPVYALRPAKPLQVVAASSFYSPSDSFVYPGGETDMGPARRHPRAGAHPEMMVAAV